MIPITARAANGSKRLGKEERSSDSSNSGHLGDRLVTGQSLCSKGTLRSAAVAGTAFTNSLHTSQIAAPEWVCVVKVHCEEGDRKEPEVIRAFYIRQFGTLVSSVAGNYRRQINISFSKQV